MARKAKIEPISSENFRVIVTTRESDYVKLWRVQAMLSCAETDDSWDADAYRALKRTWRKSKSDFDYLCARMPFHDLFSKVGIRL